MARTWFITGATRGIGAAIAKAALAAGEQVVATARDPAKLSLEAPADRFLALPLDVTDGAQRSAAVEAALARFGRIDILVNNAGYGHLGLFEESEPGDAERQFATNVFGLFEMTRAVLPVMRRQKSGHIFNLSSIAGLRAGPGGSLYCASKHAVEAFSEALSQEVEGLGLRVTLIEPGFFRTDFLDASSVRFGGRRVEDYAALSGQVRANYAARNHQQAGDPDKLAAAMLQLADADKPPLRFAAGSDAVEMIGAKIGRLQAELDAWRALSVSTDGTF